MRVILFGASGMIGGGVLRECLEAAEVESVLSVGRHTSGRTDLKLSEMVLPELFDLAVHHQDLTNLGAELP